MTLVKPIIPGTSIGFTGDIAPHVPPSFAEVVAIPIIHDWGPVLSDAPGTDGSEGGVQLCEDFNDFIAKFGDSDTPGRTAVAEAFQGQGVIGGDGAGGVLVARMATPAAAKASVSINNTAGPAVAALRLDARYRGVRGNDLSYSIDADPNITANDRLRIRYKGTVQESYSYPRTQIAQLAAQINASSSLVAASAAVDGAALAATAGTALAGGDSGSAVTATEHLAALDALEFKSFSVLVAYDLTDAGIQASYLSWVQTQESANRPVVLVVGGDADDTLSTALTRTNALADPHVVNLGVGTYHDDLVDKDLTTAQLAPRLAGVLVNRGEDRDITFALLAGLHPIGTSAPATPEVETAVQSGVTVLMHAISPFAELRVAKGVTTFTSKTDAARPFDVFSDPRLVRIMDIYIRGMKQWGDDTIIALPVNNDTRAAVRGEARRRQDELAERGLILRGPDADIQPFVRVEDPHDPALVDAIPYDFGWQFAHTANYILGQGKIR